MCWKDRTNDGEDKVFSVVPMIHAGTMQLECHQGTDHDEKRKEKRREEKEKLMVSYKVLDSGEVFPCMF